jgi:hypothetical protein
MSLLDLVTRNFGPSRHDRRALSPRRSGRSSPGPLNTVMRTGTAVPDDWRPRAPDIGGPSPVRRPIPGGRRLRIAWLVTPETLPRLLACAERASIVFDLSLLKVEAPPADGPAALSTVVIDGHRALSLGAWLETHDVDLLHDWPRITGESPSPAVECHAVTVPPASARVPEGSSALGWRPVPVATADLRDVVRLRWEYYRALSEIAALTAGSDPAAAGRLPSIAPSTSVSGDAGLASTTTGRTRVLASPVPEDTGCPELTLAERTHVAAIPGHLHRWDCEGLHRIARLATGPVVELGAYLGRSTVALLLGARHSAQRVFAIAPWRVLDPLEESAAITASGLDAYLTFCRQVAPWSDDLEVHCATSREVDWHVPRIPPGTDALSGRGSIRRRAVARVGRMGVGRSPGCPADAGPLVVVAGRRGRPERGAPRARPGAHPRDGGVRATESAGANATFN